MFMGNMTKKYCGAIGSELEAAQIYDKYAIIYNGLKVSPGILIG